MSDVDDIVSQLENIDGVGRHAGRIISDAADMLRFFFGLMQAHSPKMDGTHSYRFRGGWPMTYCVGPGKEAAVRAAMQEMKRVEEP